MHHQYQSPIEHLKTEGTLPPIFVSISERARARQTAAGGKNAGVDHIFDIPVELLEHFTGYRHDHVMPQLEGIPFEVLATTGATPKRSWLRRLLGV
jgi:hypothetical protein